jgi:hypothetical protein
MGGSIRDILRTPTASTILVYTGSIGAAMFYWTSGFFISLSSMGVYLEYAAYFPSRSGSEVAYLEQAYPRPKFFFPVVFAVQSVLLSFASSNAIGGCSIQDKSNAC